MNFIRFFKGAEVGNILARGSAFAFVIQGAGAALLLLTEVFVARLLGVGQFGVYSMVAAWIYVLALIGALGFNHALLRFVPSYLAHQDLGSLRGLIRRSNLWAGLAASFIAATGIAVLLILSGCCVDTGTVSAFVVALIAIPFQVLSSLRQAVLRGLDKIAHALTPDFVLRPALFVVLLGCAAFLSDKPLNAATAFALSLIAVCTAFVVGAIWQHKHLPAAIGSHAPVYHDRYWRLTAIPLLLIVGFNLISSRIDIIMLGMLSEIENVGVYSAASRVADVVVFGLVSANAVVAPMIARLYSTGRHEDLQKMVRLAAKGILLFTAPVALILLIFGKEILSLFGSEFSGGYHVLVILVCGQTVNALAGPVGYLMIMTGHQVTAAKIVGASATLNLVLNGVLIPPFGMTGAAISTAISTATWNILMLRFVKTELALKSSALDFSGKAA